MMERLNSIEEYKELTRKARIMCEKPYSNIYFMPKDIQRYIEIGQAYYVQMKRGFLLILDEEKYYRVCFYVDSEHEFTIPLMDKKAVVKNIYRKNKGEECPEQIEAWLEQMAFEKRGTSVQIKKDMVKDSNNDIINARYTQKLEDVGFRCIELGEEYYEQAENMLISTGIIRDYQIDYKTPIEKKQIINGSYLGVINDKGELCAVTLCHIEGKIAHGEGVLVLEEYKKKGLVMMLGHYRTKWLRKYGVEKRSGWILVNNETSLRYHKSAGYTVANKYADEWVRDTSSRTEVNK